ncbi:MAG: cell division GTPase [halophilic archaeon J07HB67]|jgi:Cell division GTPase|nr:MAG: cell division GTPase [halophilic archaeon J07HB67]
MRVGLVGVGRAGGAIVDELAATSTRSRVSPVEAAVAVDTDEESLAALSAVPSENRSLVGRVEAAGRGTDGDQELGVEIADGAQAELRAALDTLPTTADAVFVAAGLAGGTGGGLGPCLAELLVETATQPVYGVGVLPSDAEDETGEHAARAMRGLRALREPTADVLVADLDRWRRTDANVETAYDPLDAAVADALWSVVAASELGGDAPAPERTLDASEVINTLQGDGVATLARATNDLPTDDDDGGLLERARGLFGDTAPDVDDVTANRLITTTIREALGSNAFLAGVDSAARAAVVVDAPAAFLRREGIQSATSIVEDETGSVAVRTGDRPRPNSDVLGTTVLLAGVTGLPRLDELERRTRVYLDESPDG